MLYSHCRRPPPDILTAEDAKSLSCHRSCRMVLEIHWELGVGLYCEKSNLKIADDVK